MNMKNRLRAISFILLSMTIAIACFIVSLVNRKDITDIRIVFYHQADPKPDSISTRIISSDRMRIEKVMLIIDCADRVDVPFRGSVRGFLYLTSYKLAKERCITWFYNDVFAEYDGDRVLYSFHSTALAQYINAIAPDEYTSVVPIQ